ncbi:MAG: uracil-DNA glycosylase family protein [Patescibacteria group bacterium]
MDAYFQKIKKEIMNDPANRDYTKKGIEPLFTASRKAKIIIIGQAPGKKAQDAGIIWDDMSGDNLREYLGVSREIFYDDEQIALIPMDFYFPGKGRNGDLAPRKEFAKKWHTPIFNELRDDALVIVVGQYAQKEYLPDNIRYANLTENVEHYKEFLKFNIFPLPHPSPRNNIWLSKHPWFKKDVVPVLQREVAKRLSI